MGANKASAADEVKDTQWLPAVPLEHGLAHEESQGRRDNAQSPSSSSASIMNQCQSAAVMEEAQQPSDPEASTPHMRENSTEGQETHSSEADGVVDVGLRPLPTNSISSVEAQRALNGTERGFGNYRHSPLAQSSPSGSAQSPVSPNAGFSFTSDEAQPRTLLPISPQSRQTRGRGFSLRRSLLTQSVRESASQNGHNMELQPSGSFAMNDRSSALAEDNQSKNALGASMKVSHLKSDINGDTTSSKETRTLLSLPHYESWVRNRKARPEFIVKLGHFKATIRKSILRIHEIPPSIDGRHLELDVSRNKALIDERTGREYIGNLIRSCRYTLWNFLPRQLFAQFSKLANFYFLCVSILQMIPGLSTTGNFTTIVPLTFFVILSMAKEGYDDLRRYKLDKVENNQSAFVLRIVKSMDVPTDVNNTAGGTNPRQRIWVSTKWKDINVGDVVKLNRNEAAPADLVLLHSKGANGIAYVETMALDGETNLKSKQALSFLAKRCQDIDAIGECEAHMVVEDPNLDFYSFEGKCTVGDETLPLTNHEIIYRGSILRNTPELYGMVIYSGEECKIRMNATKNPRIKAPSLQAVVNKIVIIIVLFVLALAIFNTVAYQIWVKTTEKKAWYLVNAKVAFFPILSSFIILFNTMIPLSLYVSLEIVKLCQLYFMNDIAMYDEISDTPMEARTSTINEELGQVKYDVSSSLSTRTNQFSVISSRTRRAH